MEIDIGTAAQAAMGIGIVVLGLMLAFATYRWSKWRRHRSLSQKKRTDEKTREAYEDKDPD